MLKRESITFAEQKAHAAAYRMWPISGAKSIFLEVKVIEFNYMSDSNHGSISQRSDAHTMFTLVTLKYPVDVDGC